MLAIEFAFMIIALAAVPPVLYFSYICVKELKRELIEAGYIKQGPWEQEQPK